MAPIKAFLNYPTHGSVSDFKMAWNARKHLALKEFGSFGVDMPKLVDLIEIELLNGKHNINSHRKVAMITEIESSKRNFFFGNPESKLHTMWMKQLWSAFVHCLEDYTKFSQLNEEPTSDDLLLLKETLHVFEWIRHQLDRYYGSSHFEEQLLIVMSIAWLKLKKCLEKSYSENKFMELESVSLGALENGSEKCSDRTSYLPIIEISNILEPQIHQFNLTVRQFWYHVGLINVSRFL